MPSLHGKFCWNELMTTDNKAAESFYGKVVGWRPQDMDGPHGTYTILSASETPMGGLMAIPAEACAAGAKPGWGGYIAVDDVDEYAARVKKAGGAVLRGPADIPGIARFAVVADPHGAVFNLIKGFSDAPPKWPAPGTPGQTGWRELYAGDGESAFAFYAGLFGWTKAAAHDMGPMGIYQLFSIDGEMSGGMRHDDEAQGGADPALALLFQRRRYRRRHGARDGERRQDPARTDGGAGRKLDRAMH